MTQEGYHEIASAAEFNLRSASGASPPAKPSSSRSPPSESRHRATFEAMDFNRREKTWMVNYIQNKWKISSKVAEESYRLWLNGFTTDGKIPLKDFQEVYDAAFAANLIPNRLPVFKVIDYSLLDEVLKEKK